MPRYDFDRDLGFWELPKPFKGKQKEWHVIARVTLRQVPFGYRIHPEDDNLLEPISEVIEMTAPVLAEGKNKKWVVSFVMPKEYSLDTLPKPNNKDIRISSLPPQKYAVIVFSGLVRESNYDEQINLLKSFVANRNLVTVGKVQIARYNPPWTLPFFRRNELMIRIN